MAKYRRRIPEPVKPPEPEEVEAIYCVGGWPRGKIASPVFVYRHADGTAEIDVVDGFERDYERAEASKDSWYLCADCDQPIPPSSDWLWKHGMCGSRICEACGKKRQAKKPKPLHCQGCGGLMDGHGRFTFGRQDCLCHSCYCLRKAGLKPKPAPLTLADLVPGDMYHPRGDSDHTDQLLGWRENGTSLHYCQPGKRTDFDLRTLPVSLARHHPITPKQQLWIDATPEEREALEDSIRDKGLPILRGEKRGRGTDDCPLCHMFRNFMDGEVSGCCSSKGGRLCLLQRHPLSGCGVLGHYMQIEHPESPTDYRRARAFWLKLAELLPNIHPLRIEVEATPVEWPGAKK